MKLRRFAAAALTASAALILYAEARPSPTSIPPAAAALKFEPHLLRPEGGARTVRPVNRAYARLRSWISAVGGAAALGDIQGVGRPSDICLVDARDDSVTISPAPGTGQRFAPFTLPHVDDGYDPATIAPMGCLIGDLDEDGNADLVVYYWGRTPVLFLRRPGVPLSAAAFKPRPLLSNRERWYTNAGLFADVDGDGHPDLVFGNYFPTGSRVLDARSDGEVEMQHSMSRAFNGGRNRLFLWAGGAQGMPQYRDASAAVTPKMADGWTLALGARDLNGDLLPEIYVANDFGPDRLLLNLSSPGRPAFRIVEGRRGFFDARSRVLGQDSFKGMGVDFGDLTHDGRPSIAVSNIAAPYALLESHFLFMPTGDGRDWAEGHAPYRDEGDRRGVSFSNWGWDMRFADLNNDGEPELIQAVGFLKGERNRWPELQELAMSNDELLLHPAAWPRFQPGDDLSGHDHDRIYVADAQGRFHDVWPTLGLGAGAVSRGVATADVYGDGRLAVLFARQWGPSLFLRNVSMQIGRAIDLDLRTRGVNGGTRPLIGAVASVRLADGRLLSDAVDGGAGHSGKRAPEIHFGVGRGPSDEVFKVQISWRELDARGRSVIRRVVTPVTPGRHRLVLGGDQAPDNG